MKQFLNELQFSFSQWNLILSTTVTFFEGMKSAMVIFTILYLFIKDWQHEQNLA
jgi:hypothetical protein